MDLTTEIRPETAADRQGIRELLTAAFGGSKEADLVDALRDDGALAVSLTADQGGAIIGYIGFSRIRITGERGTTTALALAPVAVHPEHQRRGTGAGLIRTGLSRARVAGFDLVVIVGHADYYPRFGFKSARARGIYCPFEVLDSAWMLVELETGSASRHAGTVEYHAAFLKV
jgi:putative acetyltransferase